MKKSKIEVLVHLGRQRSIQILVGLGFTYLVMVSWEVPFVLRNKEDASGFRNDDIFRRSQLESEENVEEKEAPVRPLKQPLRLDHSSVQSPQQVMAKPKGSPMVSGLVFDEKKFNSSSKDGFSELHKAAKDAFELGNVVWKEIRSGKVHIDANMDAESQTESCPRSIFLSGSKFLDRGRVMEIPCGLALGSSIAVVGKPRAGHAEKDPKISILKDGDQSLMVSQFMLELQGLKTVDGEEPPKILHFNPRLKGDWSERPVIELNTCYRMQWGTALRCEGLESQDDEETVDGHVKCEKWIRGDEDHSGDSVSGWWLNRLIGGKKKVPFNWPYPFSAGKHFVLTISAGLEGYHINVDGRHIASFPYHTGFSLEDATGLYVNGDIDVHSVFAASLPASHPSFAPQKHLEMSSRWRAPPIHDGKVELLLGVLSAGHHFAERMAVRKSWMQHNLVKSSNAVARFFVALHARREVNAELKKEAEYFGDIVIVPYMDNYDLLVLKTVAICEYGVRVVSAKYIMKCDDDTFVRPDALLSEAKKISYGRSLYIGNINYYHRPMRHGKWAVTYDEWPEEEYPPYANGAGYLLSSDIAQFIVSEFQKHKLRLFKMEDVSVGMWVEQFSRSSPVEYVHSLKFCQFGCIENYWTAHYQSPKQMMCLWNKLQEKGKGMCCNMR